MKENQRESNVDQNQRKDQKNQQEEGNNVESGLKKPQSEEREGEGTKMPGRESKTPVADRDQDISKKGI